MRVLRLSAHGAPPNLFLRGKMKLSAMQEAMLLDGARSVSDERRDEYFAAVAEALREGKATHSAASIKTPRLSAP